MRVALLQLGLDAKSRAANTQIIIAGIQRAAKDAPAPDLLVLPGGCDTGGSIPSRRLSEACLQSVRETIAWQARDWGIFVAAGLHCRHGSTLVPWGAMFDPDGDLIVQDRVPADDVDAVPPVEVWSTEVGPLGVVEPSVGSSLSDRLATVEHEAFIAVPSGRETGGGRRRGRVAGGSPPGNDVKATNGVFWCAVTPAGYDPVSCRERGLGTFVRDPEGNVIATADNAEETIVHAEVPLIAGVPKM